MHSTLLLIRMHTNQKYSQEPLNSSVMEFSMVIMPLCLPMVRLELEKLTRTFINFLIIHSMLGTEDKPGIMFQTL
jgi:hypothetical protein